MEGFAFTELPAELRIAIYEYHAHYQAGHLGLRLKTRLRVEEPVQDMSPLLLASRLTHREYYDVLERTAALSDVVLVVRVTDLDFRAVLSALKKLKYLKLVTNDSGNWSEESHKILVRLTLTDEHKFNASSLGMWLAFCAKTGLTVRYKVQHTATPELKDVYQYFEISEDIRQQLMGRRGWWRDDDESDEEGEGGVNGGDDDDFEDEFEGDGVMEGGGEDETEGGGEEVEIKAEEDDHASDVESESLDSDMMSSEEDFTDEEVTEHGERTP